MMDSPAVPVIGLGAVAILIVGIAITLDVNADKKQRVIFEQDGCTVVQKTPARTYITYRYDQNLKTMVPVTTIAPGVFIYKCNNGEEFRQWPRDLTTTISKPSQ